VFQGPDPAGVVDALREMETSGATIVQGNTDVAVADFDYSAAFPHFTDGVPDAFRDAAEWAHDQLGDERVAWLRRLPAERRLMVDDTMLLGCHASPGSQTQGFDTQLDPTVTIERVSRTDARVICCGHTHLPNVQEFGWKVIVNDGSAGYVFDGDPTASWALVTIGERTNGTPVRTALSDVDDTEEGDASEDDETDDERSRISVNAEIRRTEYDVLTASNAISARGLPGDVYRAATVRAGRLIR